MGDVLLLHTIGLHCSHLSLTLHCTHFLSYHQLLFKVGEAFLCNISILCHQPPSHLLLYHLAHGQCSPALYDIHGPVPEDAYHQLLLIDGLTHPLD
jgi:hypothetical protein